MVWYVRFFTGPLHLGKLEGSLGILTICVYQFKDNLINSCMHMMTHTTVSHIFICREESSHGSSGRRLEPFFVGVGHC